MNHQGLIDFFNYQKPTPREIQTKYKIIDLSAYQQLTWENILYALITCKPQQAVRIPQEYGERLFQVKGYDDKYLQRPWLRHWMHSPDVMLNTTEMTIEDAKRFVFGEAVCNSSYDYNEIYRGFGVIDPRSNKKIIWPFLYLVEGLKLFDLAQKMIKTFGKDIDITGKVPSLSNERMHTVTLRNAGSDVSAQVYSDCTCLWPRYGLRRRTLRSGRGYDYVSGQELMCRHGISLYRKLEEEGITNHTLPKPTGILNPWYTLKQRVMIGDEKVTKTQMNVLLGMLIAYLKENNISPFKFQS